MSVISSTPAARWVSRAGQPPDASVLATLQHTEGNYRTRLKSNLDRSWGLSPDVCECIGHVCVHMPPQTHIHTHAHTPHMYTKRRFIFKFDILKHLIDITYCFLWIVILHSSWECSWCSCCLHYYQIHFSSYRCLGVNDRFLVQQSLLTRGSRHFLCVIDHFILSVDCSCCVLLPLLTSWFLCTNLSWTKYHSLVSCWLKRCFLLQIASYFFIEKIYILYSEHGFSFLISSHILLNFPPIQLQAFFLSSFRKQTVK